MHRFRSFKGLLSLCALLVGALPASAGPFFAEGFSGTAFPPAGWVVINESTPTGDLTWARGPVATAGGGLSRGGDLSFAGVNFESAGIDVGGNPALANNWLIMPPLGLHNGDRLSLETRLAIPPLDTEFADVYPDRLQVWLNESGTSLTSGFTRRLLDINPTYELFGYPQDWAEYHVDLSGLPAGGITGRLGIRYFVEDSGPFGTRGSEIWVDSVTVSAVPEPAAVTAAAVAVGALLRRHRRSRVSWRRLHD